MSAKHRKAGCEKKQNKTQTYRTSKIKYGMLLDLLLFEIIYVVKITPLHYNS